MTSRSSGGLGRARRAPAAVLAIAVVMGLPVGVAARPPASVSQETVGHQVVVARDPVVALNPVVPHPVVAPAPDLRATGVAPGDSPSQMYLDSVANEARSFPFTPGGRVSVAFRPRADDRWSVDGHTPGPLPAGLASGATMAGTPPTITGAPTPPPARTSAPAPTPPPAPAPLTDPSPIPAVGAAFVTPGGPVDLGLAAVGMRREVYGFLPYWEVSDPDTRLDFSIITHLAYFSVGADAKGNLKKRNSDGSLTTGWAGWTSSQMTSVINAAHKKRSRVTLTVSVFAWTSGQAALQKALLGSSTARLNLARQIVAAVRDRGADGVNLDFEPLVSGSEDGFVAFIRTLRAEFRKVSSGYHISFDTLGRPGNYPLERALAAGGADAVFIMGYDYRTASSSNAGSIDPLAGPAYDLTDTVRTYTARVPASRVILGIPYYGRAWSTVSDGVNARTQTGAKYGYSSAVNYSIAAGYAADYGRRYDGREVSAWLAYRKQSCTSTYGCLTTWRQIYYDDAATLKARYDMVNRAGLRGTGIWALGYDGTRHELYQALADKFLHDTTPPQAGIVAFGDAGRRDAGFVVRWTAVDDWSGIASFDVQASADGGAWSTWLAGTKATSGVYLGADNAGYAFRVRARDGKGNLSAWNVADVYVATPALARGGFVRVVADTLNLRSAPSTGATRLATASLGDVLSITGGPVSSGGYAWYELTGPVSTWAPVGDVATGMWAAVSGSGTTNAVAARAPSSTFVRAGIRAVRFSGVDASIGGSAAATAARSFSPNGDGSEDRLAIAWNNRRDFDSFGLRIYRPDGTLLGSRSLGTTAAGAQQVAWDGTANGSALPDGVYILQLTGSAAGVEYTWPASSPTSNDLPAAVAVTLDRVPPAFVGGTLSGSRISPNGDGRYDSSRVAASASVDAVRWELLVRPFVAASVGDPVRRITGTGRSATVAWNGTNDGGTRVPDGVYRVQLRFFDAAGNPAVRAWDVTVDTTPPVLSASATPAAVSPDGDGVADRMRIALTATEAITGTARIVRGSTVVRSWTISGTRPSLTWNGLDSAGRLVADGRYTLVLAGADSVANRAAASIPLVVDRTAGWLRWSAPGFYPQDGDRIAAAATVAVRVAHAATLTLRILDAAGAEVRRAWSGKRVATGTAAWRWDGRTRAGAWAPPGQYVAELTAVGPYGKTVLRRSIVADAFLAAMSTSTPRPGSRFSVTFRSVEPLAAAPTAYFRQAGRSSVPMTVVRLSDGSWRASVIVAGGAPGRALVALRGRDAAGGQNRTTLSVTVP
jgi:spore germination protein YaaH/flagellar hook assembly protein FlgD